MQREIEYLKDKDIVLITTSGTYILAEEVETLRRLMAKLTECNCNKCLFDHRKTHVIAKTLESYDRSRLYQEIVSNRTIRAAIVLRELHADYQFYETTVRNRGWDVKIFDAYDTAMEWLTE